MTAESVSERVARVEARIEAACVRAGRPRSAVRLVAVSKQQPSSRLRAGYEAGLRCFGENRVQEAEAKRPELPDDIEWHLVGPLQSNKVKRAVEGGFTVFHAVDRVKIGRRLDRDAGDLERTIEGYLEVNLGAEPSKHGFPARGLRDAVAPLAGLRHLRLIGLMAIPPIEEDPERTRAWFQRLRALRDELAETPEWRDPPIRLSMGMSDDFEIAIEEGATDVRIGTALFGPRDG